MSTQSVNFLKFLITGDGTGLEREIKKSKRLVTGFVDEVSSGFSRLNSLGGLLAAGVGLGAVAGVMGKILSETQAAEREQAQLAASLKSTGHAAGYSQTRMNEMAGTLQKVTAIAAGEFTQAQTVLNGFVNIVGAQYPKALRAAADYSTRTGASMKASAEVIGRALDIPSAGMASLQRQGFKFSASQIELARKLERTGNIAQAQSMVLDALNETYGGAAVAARDTFGGALKGLQNQINSLLTGDSGSLTQAKVAVQALTQTLSSDSTRQAFQTFIGWLAQVSAQALQTASVLTNSSLWGWLQIGKSDAQDLDAAIAETERKIAHLQDTVRSMSRPLHRWWNADDILISQGQISTLQAKLKSLLAMRSARNPAQPNTVAAEDLPLPDLTPRSPGAIDLKAVSAVHAQRSAYESLIASIRTKREQMRLELVDDEKLTESQKIRIRLDQDMAQGRIKLSAAQGAALKAELALLQEQEQRMQARKGRKLTDQLLAESNPLAADFAQQWKLIADAYDGTADSLDRLTRAQAVLLARQPFAQQAAAIQQSRAEAEHYLATLQRAQAREVQLVGMGGRQREYYNGINQIEDSYAGRRYDLGRDREQARMRAGGQLAPYLESFYNEKAAQIDEFERKAKASYRRAFEAIGQAQGNWLDGARRAFDDYAASAANVAEQTAGLFGRVYGGLEEAALSFATTGKSSFKDYARTVIAELIRIQLRAQMVSVLGGARGGGLLGTLFSGLSRLWGGGSQAAGVQASGAETAAVAGWGTVGAVDLGPVAGGRAKGGAVAAGKLYEVNEQKLPELLHIGERQFLMMAGANGYVTPLQAPGPAPAGGGRPAPVHVDLQIVNQGAPVDAQVHSQSLADGSVALKVILSAVAEDLADGGVTARATRQRFNLQEA